ncbi:MAG: DDE-type integrase/transposase/recombinase [Elusimicrobia bacterium]|nr:DDE-type integrase/transposase/recombinase [Elusimicrobiota bacterium]
MKLGRIYKRSEKISKLQLHKRISWRTVWQIVQAFVSRQMSEKMACQSLEISRARLYVLRQKWLKVPRADQVTPQWLYQKSNSLRLSSRVCHYLEEEIRYIKTDSEYFKNHFNFAFLAQQCHQRFGKRLRRNTLRRWAIREGLYHPEQDSTSKAYVRFEMGAIGLLWQHDSSHHGWLPLTRRNDVLILTKDDHSRKVVGGLLVPRDTSWHHLCVVRESIETYGCPVAYYLDNFSIFRPKTEPQTQFSRALSTAEINLKFTAKAHPEAKGKIEKQFDYFQRRIPYLCERYRITSLKEANKILRDEIHYYNDSHIHAETGEIPNKRWNKALLEKRSFLKPIPQGVSLDIAFSLHYPRAVRGDGTISFAGKFWKVPNAPRYQKVTIALKPPTSSRRPLTEIFILHKGSTLAHFVLTKGESLQEPLN